jgi:hypothetical protein
MWRPVVDVPIGNKSKGRGRKDSMGLCFFVEDNYGMRLVGHSGGQNAFVTHFYLHPGKRAGYAVAFNTRDDDRLNRRDHIRDRTSILDERIKDHLFSRIFPLFGG